MAKRPLEEGTFCPFQQLLLFLTHLLPSPSRVDIPGAGYGVDGHHDKSAKLGQSDDAKTNVSKMFELRLLIDNYEAGVIIGKGGSNVKDLRVQSSCFVSVLRSEAESKERVLTIKVFLLQL